MDAVEILVPLGFFGMIAYIAKLIGDTRIRRKILDSAVSEEMAEALLDRNGGGLRTRSALKWGLILLALGAGVLLVDVLAIGFESPLAYAVLLLATGTALLGFYLIERDDDPFSGPAPSRESSAPVSEEPIGDPSA
jgi:hypothetical protein